MIDITIFIWQVQKEIKNSEALLEFKRKEKESKEHVNFVARDADYKADLS